MTATGTQNFSRSFSYDTLNRLASMNDSNTSQTCRGLSWNYDVWGNRTAQNVTAGTCWTSSVTVNNKNQLVGSPYQYDAAGNMTADGNHTYTYDAENRLTAVDGGNTASYMYDALGRRVHKTLPGTGTFDYVYNLDGNVIGEWQVLTSPAYNWWGRSFIYMQGSLLAQYGCSTTFFIHQDHLGSTRLVSAMDKSIFANLDYLPFGEFTSSSSSGCVPSHDFTGDQRDAETSLDHTQFRQYTSSLARWMTPDPAGLAAVDPTNPQSWNRYAYVLNNPMNLVDPSGLDGICLAYIWDGGCLNGPGGHGGIGPGSATCIVDGADVGCAQLFQLFHGDKFAVLQAAFNPCVNQPLTNDLPGSCTAVFLDSAQSSVGTAARSVATNTVKYGSALAIGLSNAGLQAEGAVAAVVAGGQLSPAIGAVATNIITGTAPLAVAAAPYVVRTGGYFALGAFDYVLGKALFNEIAAIKNGQCKP
jgi:RHS repeat-associated protein